MHATGLDAALNTFFNQLHSALRQEQEKKAELEAISNHRERLTTAIRSTIATLDPPQRKHWHSKLRRMLGKDDTLRARGLHTDGFRRKAPESAGPIDRSTDLEQAYLELGWTQRTSNGTTGSLTLRGFAEDRGNGTPQQRNAMCSSSAMTVFICWVLTVAIRPVEMWAPAACKNPKTSWPHYSKQTYRLRTKQ